jgi:HSP20 family protein
MTLMRFDPFRELDRLGERMLGGPAMRAMPTEAYRRGDSFYVLIDVPGVDPSELQVTVERNVVSAQASRRSPRQEGDELLVDERPHGESAVSSSSATTWTRASSPLTWTGAC